MALAPTHASAGRDAGMNGWRASRMLGGRVGDDRVEGRNAASLPSDVLGVRHPQRARFFLPLAHEARKPHQPILPSRAHSRYSKREPHLGITTIPAAHGVCDSVRDPHRYSNSNDKEGKYTFSKPAGQTAHSISTSADSSAAVCVQTEIDVRVHEPPPSLNSSLIFISTTDVESLRLDTIFRTSSGARRLSVGATAMGMGGRALQLRGRSCALEGSMGRFKCAQYREPPFWTSSSSRPPVISGAFVLDISIVGASSGVRRATAQHRHAKERGSGVCVRVLQPRGPELRRRGTCASKTL
ncbi:hypothetical protein B0H13DRAFT_2655564 [Mycena leptocephala]|nr:hypothetical protein B0H13DRAFT_2655564 [Mycena leptocephala]